MKKLLLFAIVLSFTNLLGAQSNFSGLNTDLGNLFLLSDAKSRSISPENFTGEKGNGGMPGGCFFWNGLGRVCPPEFTCCMCKSGKCI